MKKIVIITTYILSSLVYNKVSAQKINIVFVLADDMGYGDVGFTGQKKIQTPFLDSLSKQGILFNDFYAGAPVCSPSRFMLITGRNAGHATIRGNATIQGGTIGYKGNSIVKRANILPQDSTIGNIMQSAGYMTALMGKWHIGGYDSLATPIQHGFQTFKGWLINQPETYASTYWPAKWIHQTTLIDIPQNQNNSKGYYTCDIITDDAISYLKERKQDQKPFFLMVNHSNPHSPLDAPVAPIYKDSVWTNEEKTYASMVSNVDASVKKITDYLVSSGLDKNTIVIFTSDNGPRSEPTKQLTAIAEFFNSSGPLRGYKRDLTEGGIREPFILWSNNKNVEKRKQINTPLYFPDILPTLGGIANYANTKSYKTEGTDFSSLIFSKRENKKLSERPLYWEFFEGGFVQAIRYKNWKAIIKNNNIELYDLSKDIHEDHNIASQNPKIIQKIKDILLHSREESPYWPTKESS
ncbi:sulfatase-like hydrolase/transferase [Rhizosphaericola mali]|uniref:sulfatase-like hydrolase/transferase n=1 Tax=Rhizosphaericola mali TaxID=2545455 RepID=UPI001CD9DDA2|nr:sulfatase-like hydrolase/transferase [Rhizosphaericola mali]